ncbi:hypothetical protein BKA80DRAFT_79907 [Phyllosticta citrichinensis]
MPTFFVPCHVKSSFFIFAAFATLPFSPPWLYASTQRQSGAFCWHGNCFFASRRVASTASTADSCPPLFDRFLSLCCPPRIASHPSSFRPWPGLPHHASAFSSPPVPPLTGEAGGLQRNASTQPCQISRPSLPLHHMCGVASMSQLRRLSFESLRATGRKLNSTQAVKHPVTPTQVGPSHRPAAPCFGLPSLPFPTCTLCL